MSAPAILPDLPNPLRNGVVNGDNIELEEYRHQLVERGHPDFVMGRSDLMDFAACPHKWRCGYESDDTEATEWGTFFECLVMWGAATEDRFAICPETYPDTKTGEPKPWTFAAKFCKEWREAQGNKQIVKAETWTQAQNAVKFFYGNRNLAALVGCSKKQVMVEARYTDKETGLIIPIHGLIDFVPDKGNEEFGCGLADLKTTRSAVPFTWGRDVFTRGYHVQAALYLDLWNAATREGRTDFRHAVSESGPPWETACRVLSQDFVTLGRMQYIEALKRYAACLKTDTWPGYDTEAAGTCWQGWLVTEPEPWMVSRL